MCILNSPLSRLRLIQWRLSTSDARGIVDAGNLRLLRVDISIWHCVSRGVSLAWLERARFNLSRVSRLGSSRALMLCFVAMRDGGLLRRLR